MTTLVLIGYSIIVFYAGIFVGAWWMNRAHAIRTLEGDDWDGDGEPRGGDNVVQFTKGDSIKRGAEIYQVMQ